MEEVLIIRIAYTGGIQEYKCLPEWLDWWMSDAPHGKFLSCRLLTE